MAAGKASSDISPGRVEGCLIEAFETRNGRRRGEASNFERPPEHTMLQEPPGFSNT